MQIRPADLERRLAGGDLRPAYLVTGDEPLLVQEACDAIVRAAAERGFGERVVHHADAPRFDWYVIVHEAGNLSLFGERKLIDVRAPAKTLDKSTSEAIRDYLAAAPDAVLLLRSGRLDGKKRNTAWYKAIDKAGVTVPVWPLAAAELPRWLEGRVERAGLELDRDGLALLAAHTEGNLLAAVQEIEKLRLLHGGGRIDAAAVQAAVADSAHFDAFELMDAMAAGASARVVRIVRALEQEGVAVLAVLGALTFELKRMLDMHARRPLRPQPPPQRLRRLERAVGRLGARRLEAALAQASEVDLAVKGMRPDDPWLLLERLLLDLAGAGIDNVSDTNR